MGDKRSEYVSQKLLDSFYEEVARDIENNIQDKGIWVKAFARAGGDERKAKALYIELMVENMILQEEAIHEEKLEKKLAQEEKVAREIAEKKKIERKKIWKEAWEEATRTSPREEKFIAITMLLVLFGFIFLFRIAIG